MAFVKKTWKDRIVQYANRRLLTKSGGEVEQVTVTRDEGTISEAGDQFNASTMNDLENRIYNADTNMKTYVDTGLSGKEDSLTVQTITPTRNTTNVSSSGYSVSCLKYGRIVILSLTMNTAKALTNVDVLLSDLPIPQYDTLRIGLSVLNDVDVRCKIDNSGVLSLHYDDLNVSDTVYGIVTYISAS